MNTHVMCRPRVQRGGVGGVRSNCQQSWFRALFQVTNCLWFCLPSQIFMWVMTTKLSTQEVILRIHKVKVATNHREVMLTMTVSAPLDKLLIFWNRKRKKVKLSLMATLIRVTVLVLLATLNPSPIPTLTTLLMEVPRMLSWIGRQRDFHDTGCTELRWTTRRVLCFIVVPVPQKEILKLGTRCENPSVAFLQ